jgi:hypothetical protein
VNSETIDSEFKFPRRIFRTSVSTLRPDYQVGTEKGYSVLNIHKRYRSLLLEVRIGSSVVEGRVVCTAYKVSRRLKGLVLDPIRRDVPAFVSTRKPSSWRTMQQLYSRARVILTGESIGRQLLGGALTPGLLVYGCNLRMIEVLWD